MPNAALRTLIGLVAGLATGVVISSASWSGAAGFVAAIEPVGNVWVNAIRMTIIPLVVSLLVATIAEEKDPRVVGRLGGRAVALFAVILSTVAILTFLAAPPLFSLMQDRRDVGRVASRREFCGRGGSRPPLVHELAHRPRAVQSRHGRGGRRHAAGDRLRRGVRAWRSRASSRQRRTAATALFRGLADAMLVIVGWVLAAAPIGVFCLSVGLAARLGVGVAGAVAIYLALHSGFLAVFAIALYAVVRAFSNVPLARFARALIPAQIVAVSTRSSVAALPAMIDGRDTRAAPADTGLGIRAAVRRVRVPAQPGGHLDRLRALRREALRRTAHARRSSRSSALFACP